MNKNIQDLDPQEEVTMAREAHAGQGEHLSNSVRLFPFFGSLLLASWGGEDGVNGHSVATVWSGVDRRTEPPVDQVGEI